MPPPAPPAKPVEVVNPARKKRATVDPNETKADKFKRLANHRIPRLIKLFNAVSSLANKSQYEYTQEQVDKITGALKQSLDAMTKRFAGVQQIDSGFTL